MAQVFLSYSTKSKAQVETLAEDLETAGHQIWFDHKLTGGQAWWDQILANIRQCDLFVFALTPEALESAACQREYSYAHQLDKNVLPILVADGVPIAQLPPELSSIQFVDYRAQDRGAALKLMNALNHLPAQRPLPDPLPETPPVPVSYMGSLREQIDSAKPLNFDEQAALLFRLNEHLDDVNDRENIVSLLRRLKARDDIFAKIDKQIDAMLISAAPIVAGRLVVAPSEAPFVSYSVSLSKAQPKTDSVPVQPPARITNDRMILTLGLFVVASAVVWAGVYSFIVSSTGEGYRYYQEYETLPSLLALIVPIGVVIHGLVSGLILRGLEPSPRAPFTIARVLRSLLMGGPFNGFLIQRIVQIGWMLGVLIAVFWCVCIPISVSARIGLYFNSAAIGGLVGLAGGLLSVVVLAWARRSYRRQSQVSP
ncbi:MAG: toll/interleukin-1 receptor domain-containing protein [Chloroflexota bacterium]